MTTNHRTVNFARRPLAVTAALTAFLGAGLAVAHGQQPVPASATPASTVPTTTLNLSLPAMESANDLTFSSSSDNQVAVAENHFDFLNAFNAQPGQRRYGRPRYRGSNTNPDGSNKYTFFAGAGFTQPVGNTYHYYAPSYSFQVGGGRNFNQNVGLMLQFDWDNIAPNYRSLQYFTYTATGTGQPEAYGLDGHAHVWSFSLNPIYNIKPESGNLGAYVTAGAGFYHKNTQFTIPQQACYFDYYYGYVCYQANSSFAGSTYNSNAVGFNGGLGFTYKISRFSSQRFYGEVRYVVTLNSARSGATLANAYTYPGNNFFPINSHRTTYLPVKFGLRF